MVGLTPRPYIVVANRWAGSGKAHGLIDGIAAAMGGKPEAVIETNLTPAFASVIADALARIGRMNSTAPVVVCVGGDGTLSLTLNALPDPAAVTLALIPCGSGNDLALTLGIRAGSHALEVLRAGTPRSIDYGTVNGRRFVNCVGMGLDAEVAGIAARIRERGLAKGFSYYVAAVRGLFSVRSVRASVDAPTGSSTHDDAVMITIGNGRWYGGGFHGAPRALLDDGLLDCYVFGDLAGFWKRFALMQCIRAGAHESEPNVTHLLVDRLCVTFERSVAMHVDGELMQTQRAEIALVPLGARVLAPPAVEINSTAPPELRSGTTSELANARSEHYIRIGSGATPSTIPKNSKTRMWPATACSRGNGC